MTSEGAGMGCPSRPPQLCSPKCVEGLFSEVQLHVGGCPDPLS